MQVYPNLLRNAVAATVERCGAWEKEAYPEFGEILRELAKHERVRSNFIDAELYGKSDTFLNNVRAMLRDETC